MTQSPYDDAPQEREQADQPAPSPEGTPDYPIDDARDGAETAEPDGGFETDEAAGAEPEESDEVTLLKKELAERTLDLQRIQAEFLNYKRRVERDRELIRENATYAALSPIIEVLDTIDRARDHGPLEGGFKAVADQLERTVARLGLAKFGQAGDAFDPNVHEALSHIGEDPEVEVTTCKVIAKAGYRIGDRVVRAAQVLVVDPPAGETIAEPPTEPTAEPAAEPVAQAADEPAEDEPAEDEPVQPGAEERQQGE